MGDNRKVSHCYWFIFLPHILALYMITRQQKRLTSFNTFYNYMASFLRTSSGPISFISRHSTKNTDMLFSLNNVLDVESSSNKQDNAPCD